MATRIHNFSYSGSNGTLTFVPCIGNETACKVYIKALRANVVPVTDGQNAGADASISLSSRSADNSQSLIRAYVAGYYPTSANNTTITYNVRGGCSDSFYANIINIPFRQYVGSGLATSNPVGGIQHQEKWHVPEYFYLKPNDSLAFAGFTGSFHLELMAISES